jgi:HlyD family secretion protein
MNSRIAVVAVSSVLAAMMLASCSGEEDGSVSAQGTVEVRSVDVAPLVAGRVLTMRVDEGAVVHTGDTLAVLTAPTIAADLDAAAAWVRVAEANLRDLNAGARPQEIEQRQADLATAMIEATRLAADRDRYQAMLEAGAISPREAEQVTSAAGVAAQRVSLAEEALSLLREGPREQRIIAARAELARAQAAQAGREAANAEYFLIAPVDGVVLSRLVEPGDMLNVGKPALVLGQVAEPWVRVYLPAHVLPRIAVGDAVEIAPPASGDRPGGVPWSGHIVAINPQAEYVTRVALTEEERADLLFGVKVAIDDSTGGPKPGLPVVVTLPTARTAP